MVRDANVASQPKAAHEDVFQHGEHQRPDDRERDFDSEERLRRAEDAMTTKLQRR